jgi:hypothetical protein
VFKSESVQTVPTEPVQNVATQSAQWQQNVSTKWKQNVATPDTQRKQQRKKETEKTDRENQDTWEKTIEQVTKHLPPGESASQLTGTTLIEVTDTRALIFVPNRFAIPWLERRLYGQITKALKGVLGKDVDLLFVPAS